MPNVELLGPARYDEAGAVLSRAFFNDPMWTYMLPEPARREKPMRWIFTRWIHALAPLGTSHITEDGAGVALWMPPGVMQLSVWRQLRAGFWQAFFRLTPGEMRRGLPFEHDVVRRQKRELDVPHWILNTLGVDSARQRSGAGSALITHMLARADQERVPAYLITHNPRNVAYYQRFGFQAVREDVVWPGGPFVCSMRRPVP